MMAEHKVVHFNEDFTLKDIEEALSSRDDIAYFTRYLQEKGEFHIVKRAGGELNVTPFVSELFGFYKKVDGLPPLIESTRIKGNDTFAIIMSVKDEIIERLRQDLNILLKK